jgi:hypothetical protein
MKVEVNRIFLTGELQRKLLEDYLPQMEEMGVSSLILKVADVRKGDFAIGVEANVPLEKVDSLNAMLEEISRYLKGPEVGMRFGIPSLNETVPLTINKPEITPPVVTSPTGQPSPARATAWLFPPHVDRSGKPIVN